MRISVVVPAYNEERTLPATLAAIRAATPAFEARGWTTELVVCDNNSTDRTAEIARQAGAEVVFEPRNQISRARNAGAARATGDWLIFIDADSQPSQPLFADVAREIDAGRCLAGGSTIQFDVAPWHARMMATVWNAISRVNRWAAGSFIFCEAVAFRSIGGFSEELYASEELELFRRLKVLARRTSRTIAILHRHPLVTSSRKVQLYRWHEVLPFMVKSALRPSRTFRSAEDCFAWYDGRR